MRRAADQTPVAQGPRASGLVRPAAPLTPTILGRRARPHPGPGLRGDPSAVLPAPSPGTLPSHLPAERRSPQAGLSRSPRPRSPAAGCRPLFSGPTVAPPPLRAPPPGRLPGRPRGHASPGGGKFAWVRTSHSGRTSTLGPAHPPT